VLARLDANESVLRSYLSVDGTQILIEGAEAATEATLLEACGKAVASTGLQPKAQDPAKARAAWEQRSDRKAWLPHGELWRLSWREAETFTDRLLVELEKRSGPKARELRPLLVESFFDGLRPKGGGGPHSSAWLPGAKVNARRQVILARASELLTPQQTEATRLLLSDTKAVSKLARGR
jgi:hypothetical protein